MLIDKSQNASAITVTSISPAQGSTSGNNTVTITGSGFMSGAQTLTMQGFGADTCANMPIYPAAGSSVTLTDTRNNQTYEVRKLADGNCWMVNNLKLGSETSATPLTPANTNITRDWTLPMIDNTITSNDYDIPRVFSYSPQSNDITDPTFYGYHYNWCAATGGDPSTCTQGGNMAADATQDICPANWRLPRGGFFYDPDNEFSQLNAKMAGFSDNQDTAYQISHSSFQSNFLYDGAFQGVFAGNRYAGSWNSQGYGGDWWSSSYMRHVTATSYAFFVSLGSSGVDISGTANRYSAFAVRCLTQAGTTDTNGAAKPTVVIDGLTIDPDDITVISDTEIQVKMPAHDAGIVNVEVGFGSDTQTAQYEYVSDGGTLDPTGPTNPIDPIVPSVPNTGRKY